MDTVFSKIIAGEIPAEKIYEDDIVLAFLDIKPIHPGHTLVIPKKASVDGLETEPEIMAHVIKVAQRIGNAQKAALSCHGVNFIMNNGAAAGQEVFHTHLHVVPRYKNDNVFTSPKHNDYTNVSAAEIAASLAQKL